MFPTMQDCEPAICSERLREVEQRLCIQLPDEYRKFLLAHNGGRLTPSVFRFKYETGTYTDSCIDWFLAIYDGEYDNFESYFRRYKIDRIRVPPELIPIAHDPGGSLICIATKGPRIGSIYFWDHEHEAEDDASPTYRNVHLVADSFHEFVDSLSCN